MSMVPDYLEREAAFWTGGADGHLNLYRCADCGAWSHPPMPRCRECLSENVGPEAASGRGVVYSFTINHQPWAPGLTVPYVLAMVAPEEDETLRLFTAMVEVAPEDVRIGLPVQAVFVDIGEDVFLPVFAPRTEDA